MGEQTSVEDLEDVEVAETLVVVLVDMAQHLEDPTTGLRSQVKYIILFHNGLHNTCSFSMMSQLYGSII